MRLPLTVLALLMISSPCAAERYVSASVGYNVLSDSNLKDLDRADVNLRNGWELTFEPGIAATLAMGSHISHKVRMESEFSVRYNNWGEIGREFGGFGFALISTGWMGNILYDFDNGPYVGVGAGLSMVTLRATGLRNETAVVPAAQGIVGFAMPVAEDVHFTVEYRLFATRDADFLGVSIDNIAHMFGLGFRFSF